MTDREWRKMLVLIGCGLVIAIGGQVAVMALVGLNPGNLTAIVVCAFAGWLVWWRLRNPDA